MLLILIGAVQNSRQRHTQMKIYYNEMTVKPLVSSKYNFI